MTGMPDASSNRLQHRRRQRSGGRTDEADPPGGRDRGRVHGQHGDDRGNRVDPGDPLLFDQLPESVAAELGFQYQACTRGEGREQSDHLGVDVEQGQAAVAAVRWGQPMMAGHARGDVAQLILAQADALGRPGGSARAQEDPPGPDSRDAPSGMTARSAAGLGPGPFGPNDLSGGRSTARPGGRPSAESDTAASGRAAREHPGEFGGRSTRVQRDDHPAGSEDADQGGGVAERVRQADGHPGPGRYPGAVQAVGPDSGRAPQAGIGQCPGSRAIPKVRCLKVRRLKVRRAALAGRSASDPFRYQCRAPFWSLVTPASVAGAGSGKAGEPGPGAERSAARRRGISVDQGCCLRPVSGTARGVRASTLVRRPGA